MSDWKVRESTDLAHYGVKGMKWGVRRTPEELGHKPHKSSFKEATDAIYSNKVVNKALNSKAGNFMRSTLYNTFDVKDFDGLVTKVGQMAKTPQGIATIAAIVVLPDPLIVAGAAAYAGLKSSGVLDLKMVHADIYSDEFYN